MILHLIKSLVTGLLFIGAISMMAQNASVSGLLTETENSEPLLFANIAVKGSTTGTTTDGGGKYNLEMEPGSYTLVFSYIGYLNVEKSIELSPGEKRVLNVSLPPATQLLDQVVVTTNKSGIKVGESTVSIAVIQPNLIENTNSRAVSEVIDKVPGVNVIDGQANIRGGSGYSYGAGSRVLVLVDDLPYLAGDAGLANWTDIPVENINQIEILKGASSALYGSSAMNGIINVRTAYPTSEPLTKAAFFNTIYFHPPLRDTCSGAISPACDSIDSAWWGQQAPFETGAQLSHRQKFGNFDLVLGAAAFYQNSFRKEEFRRNGRFNFNTRYRITDNFSFGLNANFNVSRSQALFLWENPYQGAYLPFSLGGTVSTFTISKVFRYNLDPYVTYFDKFANRHKLLMRYYFVNNDNENNQSNKSDLLYGEYQYQRKFEKLNGLNVVAGLVGQKTYSNAELYGNAEYTASNIAIYLQADHKFWDKLNVSGGLRYEANTIFSPDSIVNPVDPSEQILNPEPKAKESKPVFRLGLNYQPAKSTYLRASWGQGYRFPTIAEKYITTDIGGVLDVRPNPTLKSETGWSAEIGLRQGININTWQGFFDFSLFWTEYQDMMEFTFGGADPNNTFFGFQSVNIDDTRIRGMEISFTGTGKLFGAQTEVLAGYTYIDPKYQEFSDRQRELSSSDENVLKYRFKHTIKLDAQTTLFNKLSIGGSVQYNSFMEAIDAFFEAVVLPPLPVEFDLFGLKKYRANNHHGDAVVDLRFGYQITNSGKISLLIKNIGNRVYATRPALMEAPINFTLRGDFRFGKK